MDIFKNKDKAFYSEITEISGQITNSLVYQLQDSDERLSVELWLSLWIIGSSITQAILLHSIPNGLTEKEIDQRFEKLRKIRVNAAFDALKLYDSERGNAGPMSNKGKYLLNSWCEKQKELSFEFSKYLQTKSKNYIPLLQAINESFEEMDIEWTEDGVALMVAPFTKIRWV